MGRRPIWSHLTHRRNIYTAFIFPIAKSLKGALQNKLGRSGRHARWGNENACLSRAWIAFLERASILENAKNDGYSAEMVVIDFLSEASVSVFSLPYFSLITRERATHSLANSRYMLHGRTTNSHFVKFLQVGHIVVSICETVMWDISLSTGTIGTSIYTVYSRYNYLHCLQ